MEKMLLEKCCYCLSLKVGTIVIAVVGLILQVVLFFLGIVAIFRGNFTNFSLFSVRNADEIYVLDNLLHAKLLIPCGIVMIIINAVLLYGTVKSIPKHMLPWLVLKGSLLVTSLYYQVALMVAYPAILLCLAAIPLCAYFWTVVFSHYRKLKSGNKLDTQQRMPCEPSKSAQV